MRTRPGTTVLRSHRPAPTPGPSDASVATSVGLPPGLVRRRRRRSVALAVTAGLVPAVLLAAGGLWWFVGSDAPSPATLDKAVAGIAGSVGSTTTGGGTTADGTWSVDRTITSAQGTGSYAGFRVGEVLAGVGAGTAVGRTSIVSGTVRVQGTAVEAAAITADLTAITSGDARLDHAVQGALDTSRFPTATFVLTSPTDVGRVPADGERITTAVHGDITIHGVTRPTTVAVDVQLDSDVLVVVGSTDVSFADFGVNPPGAPGVASVDDHGTLELQLYFTRN